MRTLEDRAFERARIDEIKRVVTENGGNVQASASILGIRDYKLSRLLNNNRTLRPWWTTYKRKKKLANKRARNERWQARRAQRELNGDGWDGGVGF